MILKKGISFSPPDTKKDSHSFRHFDAVHGS